MTLKPELIQGTPEWRTLRNKKVTGTDARVIAGVDPWENVVEIYLDKTLNRFREKSSPAIEHGKYWEPIARDFFEELTGCLVVPKVVLHPTINFMMASMDGLSFEGNTAVEIKCPYGDTDHNIALDGEVPPKYIPQLMHQMEVCGLKKIYYLSYKETSYKLLEVHFDEKYVENLLKEEHEFWQCVLKNIEPKIKNKYVQIDSKEWTDAANEYRAIDRQIKDLEKRKQSYKDRLLAIAAGTSSQGSGVTVAKTIRKGEIDYEAIPCLKTINLDEYRKESREEWRIKVQ